MSEEATPTFYGPKKAPVGSAKRAVVFKGFKNYLPVWTTYGYLFQIPSVVMRDRPDIVHFDFTLTLFGSSYLSTAPLLPLILLLRLARRKVVLTVHDVITNESLQQVFAGAKLKSFIVRLFSTFFFKSLGMSSMLIVHFNSQKADLVREYRIDARKIAVVPFGVEKATKPSEDLSGPAKVIGENEAVLFFGTIGPRKGIEYLIQAYAKVAAEFPKTSLVMAGPTDSKYDNYLKEILALAQNLLRTRFHHLGYLSPEEAHALIEHSYVAVLPYVYSYASPSILYWLIQHRKPVIASRIGTLAEELQGYDADLLPSPREVDGLAKALRRILGESALVAKCISYMEKKAIQNSWTSTTKEIINIYKGLN